MEGRVLGDDCARAARGAVKQQRPAAAALNGNGLGARGAVIINVGRQFSAAAEVERGGRRHHKRRGRHASAVNAYLRAEAGRTDSQHGERERSAEQHILTAAGDGVEDCNPAGVDRQGISRDDSGVGAVGDAYGLERRPAGRPVDCQHAIAQSQVV